MVSKHLLLALALVASLPASEAIHVEAVAPGVSVVHGAVNGVLIRRSGEVLAIYGDPRPKPASVREVLFTHHRRDVAWAGQQIVSNGAEAIGPAGEKALFDDVAEFWERYRTSRFHDYSNQSSRILGEPIHLSRAVRDGEKVDWHGLSIQVMETPGYTRGAVSYLFETGGKRVACVGDLIYGDGQILDLFSLQDKIPEAAEDGYHGYAARAGQVIASLRKIAAWKPDLLIPARGPVIKHPAEAIDKLTQRLQGVFANHFSIDALRWYRGDDKIRIMAGRVLGTAPVTWMPIAEKVQDKLPEWIIPITNSRLLVSKTGAAFLIDCGNRKVVEEVERLKRAGTITRLDGIYITHYHDDHTDMAQALSDEFHCPVYASAKMRDILEHPEAYRMPCLTPNAIHNVRAMQDGEKQQWNEFEFTYSYFPGQTLYHGGLLVKREGGGTILFVGDSFTPTGMDDYCLLNRNFLEPEEGFSNCLRDISHIDEEYMLINQHVPPAFRFSSRQLDSMAETFHARRALMADLFPFDDPNFGLDEQWARFYPYTAATKANRTAELKVVIRNHSSRKQQFRVIAHVPPGWKTSEHVLKVDVEGHGEGAVTIPLTAPAEGAGLSLVTVDVAFGPWEFKRWAEAIVTVGP
jgi:glyoxylase-like metal-dependent hydrolase (beta-lactamase superfamily II)